MDLSDHPSTNILCASIKSPLISIVYEPYRNEVRPKSYKFITVVQNVQKNKNEININNDIKWYQQKNVHFR